MTAKHHDWIRVTWTFTGGEVRGWTADGWSDPRLLAFGAHSATFPGVTEVMCERTTDGVTWKQVFSSRVHDLPKDCSCVWWQPAGSQMFDLQEVGDDCDVHLAWA